MFELQTFIDNYQYSRSPKFIKSIRNVLFWRKLQNSKPTRIHYSTAFTICFHVLAC